MVALVLFALIIQCGTKIIAQKYTKPVFVEDNATQIFMPMGGQSEKFASIRVGQANESCLFRIRKRDISTLLRLAENKKINIVEILPNIYNNSIPRIKKRKWILANKIGREILLALTMAKEYSIWTLNVNTKTVKVDIFEYPSGCIASTKNPESYFITILLYQISMANLDREICYNAVFKQVPYHDCCTIPQNHPNQSTCYVHVRSPLLSALESMTLVLQLFMLTCGGFLATYVCINLHRQSVNAERNNYYKLTQSPMSISYILFKLFWDRQGPLKSFVRRSMFIGIVFVFHWGTNLFKYITITVLFCLWAVLFLFTKMSGKFTLDKDFELSSWGQFLVNCLHSYLLYDVRDIYLSSTTDFASGVSLLTLPFNIKRWRIALAKVYNNKIISVSASDRSRRCFCIRLGKFLLRFPTILIYILVVLIMQTLLIVTSIYLNTMWTSFSAYLSAFVSAYANEDNITFFLIINMLRETLLLSASCYMIAQPFIHLPTIAVSFFCGLILNIVYFIPYITFVSVLTFYSMNSWKTVEERYVTLKTLIYQECRSKLINDNLDATGINKNDSCNTGMQVGEDQNGTNESNNNEHDENGSKTEYVVSKQLYDEIRERLLPYQWNLLFFAFRVVCIAAFASVVLTLVEILLESDTSPTVQVLTTLSVSALPYVMNIVACKSGDNEKNAWTENLQADVKYLVSKLTADNPELARITVAVPRV